MLLWIFSVKHLLIGGVRPSKSFVLDHVLLDLPFHELGLGIMLLAVTEEWYRIHPHGAHYLSTGPVCHLIVFSI